VVSALRHLIAATPEPSKYGKPIERVGALKCVACDYIVIDVATFQVLLNDSVGTLGRIQWLGRGLFVHPSSVDAAMMAVVSDSVRVDAKG